MSKGLSFCPTPPPPTRHELLVDLKCFSRKLRLSHFFNKQNNLENRPTISLDVVPPKVPSNSPFTPRRNLCRELDLYIDMMEMKIPYLHLKNTRPNITREEREAIRQLKDNNNIIIRPADKGGAIVILDLDDYINEGLRQLNDTNVYRKLSGNPTLNFNRDINNFIVTMYNYGHLTSSDKKSLITTQARTPVMYFLPKLHKANRPGRPIVSAVNSPTDLLSAFIDAHLKPIVPTIPSYIKDTTDFLRKLRTVSFSRNDILVTVDVKSLYTNIPHMDGIAAAKKVLNLRDNKHPHTWLLLKLIHLVLTSNGFSFNNEFYLQTSGTAMGTKMAPNYANIFMYIFESDILDTAPLKPKVWWRFIDDIFLVWPHGTETLTTFLRFLNEKHNTIQFTWEYSSSEIHFLDVTIKLHNGNYSTTLYTKPTDGHTYLQYGSSHPAHCKKSLPYSQAIRIRRICSNINDYDIQTDLLTNYLSRCGYPRPLLIKSIEKARRLDRETLLQYKVHESSPPKMNLITTFNPRSPINIDELKANWNILDTNSETKYLFNSIVSIVYRRSQNLKDILVHSDLNHQKPNLGCKPCNKPCVTCAFMDTTDIFRSRHTKITYHIRQDIDCQTHNVIYLIYCNHCLIQYIGQTSQTLNKRIQQHRSDINLKKDTSISQHFNTTNHDVNNLRVIGIQRLRRNNTSIRLATESIWIAEIKSTNPIGLNAND